LITRKSNLLWAVVEIIFVIKYKETNEWIEIEINKLMKLSFKQKEAVKQCYFCEEKTQSGNDRIH
jgi:hypothetical protein